VFEATGAGTPFTGGRAGAAANGAEARDEL